MNARPSIITALVRCYPASWRDEYGAELEDLLAQRPLTIGTILNVAWHGVAERWRSPSAAEQIGFVLMVLMALELWFDIGNTLHPWRTRLPAVVAIPVHTELYLLALATCGYVTRRRHGGSASAAGVATMEVAVLTGAPVMVAGLLMLIGLISLHGAPSASAVLTAPLFRLPEAWLWGSIGGLLSRRWRV